MKVDSLHGALLDLWVARAEGKCYSMSPGVWGVASINPMGRCSVSKNSWDGSRYFEPSKNWSHAGSIIEHNGISFEYLGHGMWAARLVHENGIVAQEPGKPIHLVRYGESALIAGMRALVVMKFGENVPEEVAA